MNSQQYPFGYLSLLDAKVGGRTPTLIRDDVAPQLAMYPFLLAGIGLTTSSTSNAGVSAVGQAAALTVPANEAWVVAGACADLTALTAAVVASISLSITPPDGTPGNLMAYLTPLTAIGPTQIIAAPWAPPSNDFIVGPGTIFNAVLNNTLSAGTGTLRVRVLFRRLPV